MSEIPDALVEKAAQALVEVLPKAVRQNPRGIGWLYEPAWDDARLLAHAALTAVWDDLPAAQPTVAVDRRLLAAADPTATAFLGQSAQPTVDRGPTCCCDQSTARPVNCPVHYTCPSECAETNHPGREHQQWVLAAILDPDVFDPERKFSQHHAAQIQVAARRHMAYQGADRLLASGVLTEPAWTDEQVKRAAARLREIEVAAVSGIPAEDIEWAAREVLDAAVGRHRDDKP